MLLIALAVNFGLTYFGLSVESTVLIAVCVVVWFNYKAAVIAIVPVLVYCIFFSKQIDFTVMTIVFAALGVISGIMIRLNVPHRITASMCAIVVAALMVIGYSTGIDEVIYNSIDSENIEELYVSACIAYGMLTGGFIYLLTVFFVGILSRRIRNNKIPYTPIAPMPVWILSDNFSMGILAGVITIAVVNIIDASMKTMVSYAVVTVFAVPLLVQGIGTFEYFIAQRRQEGKGGTIIFLLLLVITFPIGSIFLGLLDQFFRFRKNARVIKIINQDPNNEDQNEFGHSDDELTENPSDNSSNDESSGNNHHDGCDKQQR